MTTYLVIVLAGRLVGGGDESYYLVGKVVQSGGVDVVSVVAAAPSQTQAQDIANALNAA